MYVLDRNHEVHLTLQGVYIAEDTYEWYQTFQTLLKHLGADGTIAVQDACRMEHTLAPKVFMCCRLWQKRVRKKNKSSEFNLRPSWHCQKRKVKRTDKMKRLIFLVLGCVCLGLGCVGIALPILPTVPFFLATVFFFAKSSQKLHDWFIGTKMYRKHLDSFVKKKGMTARTKLSIMISVTLLMGFGFFMMARAGIWGPSILLAMVWVCHIYYFVFRVKTLPSRKKQKIAGENKTQK